MSVLWIAFGIYILGVASVLYVRPTSMFRNDGKAWKEFGLSNKSAYTVFPFWLFTILWAILSYTFATMGLIFLTSRTFLPTRSFPDVSALAPSPSPGPAPGYYVLQPQSYGPPKYVYYGPQPPA